MKLSMSVMSIAWRNYKERRNAALPMEGNVMRAIHAVMVGLVFQATVCWCLFLVAIVSFAFMEAFLLAVLGSVSLYGLDKLSELKEARYPARRRRVRQLL